MNNYKEWSGKVNPPISTELEYMKTLDSVVEWGEGCVVGYDEDLIIVRTAPDDEDMPYYEAFAIGALRPLPKPKIVGLGRFIGMPALMRFTDSSGEVSRGFLTDILDAGCFIKNNSTSWSKCRPEYNNPIDVTEVDRESELLSPFTYVATYYCSVGECFKESINCENCDWQQVCIVKITGLKEGWEYPK